MSWQSIAHAPEGPPEEEKAALPWTRSTAEKTEAGEILSDASAQSTIVSEVEQGVLAAFMLAPESLGLLTCELGLSPSHFTEPTHQLLFEHLKQIFDEGEPISFYALTVRLPDFRAVGGTISGRVLAGAAYLVELFTAFLATPKNVEYYLEAMLERPAARQAAAIFWKEVHDGI